MRFESGDRRAQALAVLYIAGTGRSGSTLLSRLLGEVDGAVSVGELRYIWERGFRQNHLCECGVPFLECPFWTDVVHHGFGEVTPDDVTRILELSHRVDRIRNIPELLWKRARTRAFQEALSELQEVLVRLYGAIADVSGARVIVDSSKDPSYAYVVGSVSTFDVAFVHLVRDSRAVAFSWTRTKARPEIHWEQATMNRRPPLKSTLLWDQHNILFEVLQRAAPAFERLRYEDFVQAPDPHLDRICALFPEHLGPRRSSGNAPTTAHSISGNPMRFERGPIAVRLDDEWRRAMPRRDRQLVTLASMPFLARYGFL